MKKYIAALFVIVKKKQHSECTLMRKWLNKSWCIYIKEYSTDIKNYKIKLYTLTGRYAYNTLLNRIKASTILFLFKKHNKNTKKKSHNQ